MVALSVAPIAPPPGLEQTSDGQDSGCVTSDNGTPMVVDINTDCFLLEVQRLAEENKRLRLRMETLRLANENAKLRALISATPSAQPSCDEHAAAALPVEGPPGVHEIPPGVHVSGAWGTEMQDWNSAQWSQQSCAPPLPRSRRARRRNRQRMIAAAASQDAWNASMEAWVQWQSCAFQPAGSEESTVEGSSGSFSDEMWSDGDGSDSDCVEVLE